MGAADINAWRRQNSDTVAVEIILSDGTPLKGNLLIPRDKSLRETFNNPADQFMDFECFRLGPTVIAKSAIRSIRPNEMPKADQLEKRLRALEKSDPFMILGVAKDADREVVRQAYITLARTYHPDRYARADLPAEILDYINAMARRINAAYSELNVLFGIER
jgi:DnaJ domain